MKIGLLEFGYPFRGIESDIPDFLQMAIAIELMGFSRIWLGEHYSERTLMHSNEVLLTLLGSHTQKIRLGTAGVLLQLHPPIRIALDYKQLESAFPKRIDLGLARGVVDEDFTRAFTGQETKEISSLQHYERKVEQLLMYLSVYPHLQGKRQRPVHPLALNPEIWIMGSSHFSAELALKFRTHYCHSFFLKGADQEFSFATFRREFIERHQQEPKVTVAVAGYCSDQTQKISDFWSTYNHAFIVPSVVGSPEACYQQLQNLKTNLGIEEAVFLDLSSSWREKVKSCTLLSQAMNLHRSANHANI